MAGTDLGTIGGNGEGLGPFGTIASGNNGMFTVAAAIWFLLQVVFGGYEWMSAGGDSKKIEGARSRITNSFIGIIIVVGSWSLLAVTGKFLGFDTLVDPTKFINSVGIGK